MFECLVFNIHNKKEMAILNELFESKFGKARIHPMIDVNDVEKVTIIKHLISKEYSLLQDMIQ